VTPASYVSAVATEHGLLPPSAVAALIRELAEKETA
jgi:translation initiation factor 2B subunit (eIF-2B alpha/beta/delta family)